MTDIAPGGGSEPASDRLQLIAAVILGAAATLTAFSAYKASELGGSALRGYTTSTRTLSDANAFYSQGNSTSALDQQLFLQYASAFHSNDEATLDFTEKMMRPELQKAVDWWSETDSAETPFDDESPYTVKDFEDANDLEKEANAVFKQAVADDDQGGKVELATLTLALTLFFAGVATLFKSRSVNLTLLGVSTVTLVVGVVQLLVAL